MERAIIIMVKAPVPGKVKTRLRPELSDQEAAELAECFLRDTIRKAESLNYKLIIAYSPVRQRRYFEAIAPVGAMLIAQSGLDLGERMFNAFQAAFEMKCCPVVMIGTDSPTLQPDEIIKAFELLEGQADAVLGRTTDGGYYLIGINAASPEIFTGVEWSSENTFQQTAQNITNLGLTLRETKEWYDVDEPQDLVKLWDEVQIDPDIAPATTAWLDNHCHLF